MKQFKFSLEPLLRLKDVEKKKIELELANCQIEVDRHQHQINSENESINDILLDSEYSVSKNNSVVSMLSIPNLLEEKKRNIKRLELALEKLHDKQHEILFRLNKKNSELKKVQEHKDEVFAEYKKEVEKKLEENRSELYNAVMHHKRKGK